MDFGRLVADLAQQSGFEVAGYIDDTNSAPNILGNYADCPKKFPPSEYSFVMAIGYKHLASRWAAYEKAIADGYVFPSIIHPRAVVSPRANIGAGCIVMAGANIDSFAELKPLSVAWPGTVVSHDSTIGNNTFLSPNCTICGFSQIGINCFIGAGAVVSDHVKIPPNTFVKAGTVYK